MHFSAGSDILGEQHVVDSAYEAMRTMYGDLAGYLAPNIGVTVDPTASVIDVATGELTGIVNVSDPGETVTSISTASSTPRGVAALVRLSTDIFRNGRRLQGRVFFGPYSDDGLDTNGQVPIVGQTTLEDGFAAMTSGVGVRLAVYSRPKPIKVGGVVTGHTEGYYGDVVSVDVPARASYLRGRAG
jgi:hypothetical protein